MARRDFVFQRNFRQRGVTYERFAQAVDEFVMGQLGLSGISNSVLGRLVLAARCKVISDAAAAADEILSVANPESALKRSPVSCSPPSPKKECWQGRGGGMSPHSIAVSAISAAIETMLLPGSGPVEKARPKP